jgi:hypothetical protein
MDPQVVEGAFAEQISSLNSSETLYTEQIATTETARQHYRTFARERKFSPDAWAQELLDSLK